MSVTIQQINTAANADTFSIAWQRLNQMANVISTQAMTVDASNTGSITVGNGHVSGYLSATLLATNTLRGGNVSTSGVLNIISDAAVSNGILYVGNSTVNTYINSTSIVVNNAVIQNLQATSLVLSGISLGNSAIASITSATGGLASQIIDSFLLANYRAAEYTITVSDINANSQLFSKLLLIHNVGNAYITEYGTITTNTALGTFSATVNTTAVQLVFTPAVSNTRIQAIRTTIGI